MLSFTENFTIFGSNAKEKEKTEYMPGFKIAVQ